MKKVFIYTLSDPRTGHVRYVGKTNRLDLRFCKHLNVKGFTHKECWIRSLKAQGLVPEMEILEEVDDSNWEECERFWISYLRFLGFDLTNLTSGGEGICDPTGEIGRKISASRKGIRFSESHRARLSAAKMGKKRGPYSEAHRANISAGQKGKIMSFQQREKLRLLNRGKRHSESTRSKISSVLKGRVVSLKTRAKLSALFKGRSLSNEHRRKLSESHKGILRSEESKRKTSESLEWSHALRRSGLWQPGGGIRGVSEIRVGKSDNRET